MKTELTAARLRELLHYDPETGVFSNRVDRQNAPAGTVLGSPTSKGYLRLMVFGASYRAHRLAWFYVHGQWPENMIDHLNGVRTDNRIANLRDVPAYINRENMRKSTSATGLLGVRRQGSRFNAGIKVAGKQKNLGFFADAESAHAAYIAAKRILHVGCTI